MTAYTEAVQTAPTESRHSAAGDDPGTVDPGWRPPEGPSPCRSWSTRTSDDEGWHNGTYSYHFLLPVRVLPAAQSYSQGLTEERLRSSSMNPATAQILRIAPQRKLLIRFHAQAPSWSLRSAAILR